MTEKQGDFDFVSFLGGAMVAVLITFVLTQTFGINKWHDRTCREQFSQAVTASDTLSVIRQDAYCNTELDR